MKIKTAFLAMTSLCIVSVPAFAHDFWLSADDFHLENAGVSLVTPRVGHKDSLNDWALTSHRVISFKSYGPAGIVDRQSVLKDWEKGHKLPIALEASGTHIVSIETNRTVSNLEAEKFNTYVDEEGIVPIQVHRLANRLENEAGVEKYSRRGKAIIQVGDKLSNQLVTQPIGHTLEITPLKNPYALAKDEALDVEVRYRGELVPSATIHVVKIAPEHEEFTQLKTDMQGHATLEGLTKGHWMMHVAWSDVYETDDEADYDTVFASLTFGVSD